MIMIDGEGYERDDCVHSPSSPGEISPMFTLHMAAAEHKIVVFLNFAFLFFCIERMDHKNVSFFYDEKWGLSQEWVVLLPENSVLMMRRSLSKVRCANFNF